MQAFAARPVNVKSDAFNDDNLSHETFSGLYLTREAKGAGVDLYVLNLDRRLARFASGAANENRTSWGTRLFGKAGAWDYDVEGVWQTGEFGAKDIRAWTLASHIGYLAKSLPWTPRFALKANVTSGDRDPRDNKLETFNPLYPNLSYFNDAALIAPENHTDVHPFVTVRPIEKLELSAGVGRFWKTQRADAVYRGPGVVVASTSRSRDVGVQWDASATWRPTQTLEIRGAYVRAEAGTVLAATGGQDTNFFMLSLQRRF